MKSLVISNDLRGVSGKLQYDVAIIGGGFSGTLLAIQLIRRSSGQISIVVINRAGLPGRGVAYSTECNDHLLNVNVGKMSVFHDAPGDFLEWLKSRNHNVASDHFIPRRLYGEYLENTLHRTLSDYPDTAFSWMNGSADSISIKSGKPSLQLDTGLQMDAEILVLATGNAPPVDPHPFHERSCRRYIPYAWAKDALDGIRNDENVLILGTGLTAIDQVLALRARKFQGTVFMLSRRGQLPFMHAHSEKWSSEWTKTLPNSIRSILSAVRQQIRLADTEGIGWRAVIDSLRESSPHIWQKLPGSEQKRFMRHVRPHWEIVRHRVPPDTHGEIMNLIRNRSLQIINGRLLDAAERIDQVDITYFDRSAQDKHTLSVSWIINCTGPGSSTRVQDGLILSLLRSGLARHDPLNMGIDTSKAGAVIDPSGSPSECIYAIGPVRKPALWESTAVPEIRLQALHLADQIIRQRKYSLASR